MLDAVVSAMTEPVAAAMAVLMPRIPPEPGADLGRSAAPPDAGLRRTGSYRRRALVRSAPSDTRLGLIDDQARAALDHVLLPEVPFERAIRRLQLVRDHIATAHATPHRTPTPPSALEVLRTLAPTTADRLLGSLELTVPTLDLSAAPDVTPHLDLPRAGEVTVPGALWDSEVSAAAGLLDRFRPGFVEPITELTVALAGRPAIAALLAVPADLTGEREIAAAHGRAHLALGVATAAAVLHTVPVPRLVGRVAAVVGIGIGAAILLLRAAPLPPGYRDAVLATVRAEQDPLPRGITDSVPVAGNWFAVVAGDPPSEVDVTANGLVTAVPGGVAVRTGRATGTVAVTLRVLADEPLVDGAGWDEIVEISWPATGRVRVVGSGAPDDREPIEVTVPEPGDYRMRVHADGRDDPGDDERYELVVWPADAVPAVVHKATDLVGHRLRGEPEPAPPDRSERAYRWVSDSELGDAATVTVVTGSTVAEVVRAFGGDPDQPRSLHELAEEQTRSLAPYAAVLAEGGAVFVVEFNGWHGARTSTLAMASVGGRAASMYWNVNALTRLGLAERGRVVASFEPLVGNLNVDSPAAEALADIDFVDPRDTTEKGLLAVERFTGHGITAHYLDRIIEADVGFAIGGN